MKRILLAVLIVLSFLSGGCSKETVLSPTEAAYSPTPQVTARETAPSPETTPAVTPRPNLEILKPIPIAESNRATIVAVGDLMCLYGQLSVAGKNGVYSFDYCFDAIRDKISSADLAICNLETLVAEGYNYTQASQPGNPKINAPESFLSAAVNCGFDVYINANNHIFDRQIDGLDKTINKLNDYGLLHTGAYATGEERKPVITDVNGIKIAVLGYTDHINGHPRNATMVDKYSEELVTSDIVAAKAAGADYIIVYIHWGKENTHKVNRTQRKMAAFIANAGADIIIGSHPHCTQGTENIETSHGTVPVFYSLGNLVSSMGRTINKDSFLVNITLEKNADTGKTMLAELTYTATLCSNTSAGRYVILPADLDSIAQSEKASALNSSRARTIKVLGDKVAAPE